VLGTYTATAVDGVANFAAVDLPGGSYTLSASAGALSTAAPVDLTVLVNPVLEPQGEATNDAFEGCLSVPGLTGRVTRYTHLRYRGFDLDGKLVERTVAGFHARVVQHECDHLDGIVYPQRMDDLGQLGFVDEMRKRQEK
jgi:peptide deformylase